MEDESVSGGEDSAHELALKTATLYFLVAAVVLGALLFLSIRKTSKILCWNCIYGSKYIRDSKEDPRMPAALFKPHSVLSKLQARYDNRSTVRKPRSEATTDYASEVGTTRSGPEHVHRYLDDDTNVVDAAFATIDEGKGTSSYDSVSKSEATSSRQRDSGYEMQDINGDPSYGTLGAESTSSQNSFQSSGSQTKLVSMTPGGEDSARRPGRFKKKAGSSSAAGSSRSASAKSKKARISGGF